MKIHRMLILFVGVGMFIMLVITVIALRGMTAAFSGTTEGVKHISLEVQRVWRLEREITDISMVVHGFLTSGDAASRISYRQSKDAVRAMLAEMSSMDLSQRDMELLASVIRDFGILEKKTDRIFSLRDPAGADKRLAFNLMIEIDGLVRWLRRDIERYKAESATRMDSLVVQLQGIRDGVNARFFLIVGVAVVFLLAFGIYLYRAVSVPLGKLWSGTEEISRGNLAHRIDATGVSDVARLAERFNEMAGKLRRSYDDLEQRLLSRTRQLDAITSVALVLRQAGNLREVLHNSLLKVLESLAAMESWGGIFLCDESGERLELAAHIGLGKEFVRQESVIKMGECLCGHAAATGEILYTEGVCEDPRHTRGSIGGEHAHVIIPIKTHDRILGVLFLYPKKQVKLGPSDLQMLETIGLQLGIAVENARLYGEVKESGERYGDLFEHSRDVLFTIDREGRITAVNEATARFSGYAKEELLGRRVMDFLGREEAQGARKMLAGEHGMAGPFIEFEVGRRDGRRAFLEISGRRMYRRGEFIGFQVSGRDVTDQKELRQLLVKAERLAAIGQVSIAMKHEVNNPLTTVIGNIELLIDRYEDLPEEIRVRLQTALDNALRIADIVKKLEVLREERTVDYLQGVKMTDLKEDGA
jgi:PAS domain S-box-containing protein